MPFKKSVARYTKDNNIIAERLNARQLILLCGLKSQLAYMYRIDYCVAGCLTRYLPQEKVSPLEASEVPRFPREITFPVVDNGSYTPLRSGLSILYYA